jgi:hypothetical protein
MDAEMDLLPRTVGAVLMLILSAFVVAFPYSSATFLKWFVPFLPLILYLAVGFFIRDYLCSTMDVAAQFRLDNFVPLSLTLSGVAFTAISLIVSFFKDEIKDKGDPYITATIFCLCVALGCFIASFMVLRFRGKYVFNYLWEGLTDNGLWDILLGLLVFFTYIRALHAARFVVIVVALAYIACLLRTFGKYFENAETFRASKNKDSSTLEMTCRK